MGTWPAADPDDDPDAAVAAARAHFAAGFDERCGHIDALITRVETTGAHDAFDALVDSLHRIGGLGGTIGMPAVSERARDFEDLVRDAGVHFDVERAREMLDALRAAFRRDVSR